MQGGVFENFGLKCRNLCHLRLSRLFRSLRPGTYCSVSFPVHFLLSLSSLISSSCLHTISRLPNVLTMLSHYLGLDCSPSP